ncbi:hypothetical protein RIF29_12550 [Crotalaria pallida]|uniref:RRM domain-containing protein n=1 Tax=Crotalaria pallida TaxID=3830 RepID=A0AAN9IN81_CROPI
MREKVRERVRVGEERGGFHPSGFLKTLHQNSVSFFFTNFPDDYGTYKLWKVFSEVGSVGDVFLPGKRDKGGRRFGFVRFKPSVDIRWLEEKLRNLWIGDRKVWVNRAKYERERPSSQVKEGKSDAQGTFDPGVRAGNSLQGAWKTPLVFRNDSTNQVGSGGLRYGGEKVSVHEDPATIELSVPKEEMDRYRECYVGQVRNLEDIPSLQDAFFKEGFFSIKITPLGGSFVLLQGGDSEEIPELLFSEKSWFNSRFKDIQRWSPALIFPERFAWILCSGIPIHAWSEGVFRDLAATIGTFISMDSSTAKKWRLDTGRMMISTKLDCISRRVNLKVNGSCYEVSLVEEPSGGYSSLRKFFGLVDDDNCAFGAETSSVDERFFSSSDDGGSEKASDDKAADDGEGDVFVSEWTKGRRKEVIRQTNLLSSKNGFLPGLGNLSEGLESFAVGVKETADSFSNLKVGLGAKPMAVEGVGVTDLVEVDIAPSPMQSHVVNEEVTESFCPDSQALCVLNEMEPNSVGLCNGPKVILEGGIGSSVKASEKEVSLSKLWNAGPSLDPAAIVEASLAPLLANEKEVGLLKRASKSQKVAGKRIQDLKRGVPLQRKKVSFGIVENLERRKVSVEVRALDLSEASCNEGKRGKVARFKDSTHEVGESSGAKSVKLPRTFLPPKKKTRGRAQSRGVRKRKSPQQGGSVGRSNSAISNSISDSNIRSCCRLHYRSDEEVPRRLWEIGKRMGVSFQGGEEVVVKLIKDLEVRDGNVASAARPDSAVSGSEQGSQ